MRVGMAMLLAVAAACGGGEGAATTAADTPPEVTTTLPPDTTVAPDTTEAGPDTTEDFSGSSGSDWCELARQAEDVDSLVSADNLFSGEPAAVEQALTDLLAFYDRAERVVPSEIAADFEILKSAFDRFYQELEQYDFDIISYFEAGEGTAFEDPGFAEAGERIGAYTADVCGIDLDQGPATGDTVDADAARDAFVSSLMLGGATEEQANCVADNVDPAFFTDAATTDPVAGEAIAQSLAAAMVTCGVGS